MDEITGFMMLLYLSVLCPQGKTWNHICTDLSNSKQDTVTMTTMSENKKLIPT